MTLWKRAKAYIRFTFSWKHQSYISITRNTNTAAQVKFSLDFLLQMVLTYGFHWGVEHGVIVLLMFRYSSILEHSNLGFSLFTAEMFYILHRLVILAINSKHLDYVCRLNKTFYVLKESSRAWFLKFNSCLADWGFTSAKSDISMFFLRTSSIVLIILVYVDDIIVTGSDTSLLNYLISSLNTCFLLKDLGALSYFLGIYIPLLRDGLHWNELRCTTIRQLLLRWFLEQLCLSMMVSLCPILVNIGALWKLYSTVPSLTWFIICSQ